MIALISFSRQIHTAHSALPLTISHPSAIIIQHYIDVSPSLDEVFSSWREGDKYKNDKQVEAAVDLLRQIVEILTGIPFLREPLLTIINRLIATAEPYHELVSNSANALEMY